MTPPLILPTGISQDFAVKQARSFLLALKRAHPMDEERALSEFGKITRRMCCGDRASGEALAQMAIWSPT